MPPINLMIKPSSGLCNLRCKYCFYADVAENRSTANYGMMSGETIELLIKQALRYAEYNCNFAFQGGEPTLAGLDFFKRVVRLQKNYNVNNVNITNSIQTNGYALNDEWAEFFVKNNFLVGVSLDGPKNIHDEFRLDPNSEGTFDKVISNIAILKKHKVEFNVLSVVNEAVAKNGKKVYNFFKQRGFKYVQFIQCLDPFDCEAALDYSLTPESYSSFLKTTFDMYYKDFMSGNYISIRNFDNYVSMLMGRQPESCGMSGVCACYFLVESNGSVYPCDFYVLDRYLMGNVKLQSFDQMIRSEAAKRFIDESRYIKSECKSCKWLHICRGGCKRHREPFDDNGRPGLNRFCKAYKEFFDYSYDRLIKLARYVQSNQNGI